LAQLAPFSGNSIEASFILQCWNQLKDIDEPALDDHKIKVFKVLGAVVSQLDSKTHIQLTGTGFHLILIAWM